MLTYEGDISNYLEFDININSYRIFELSQSHLAEKTINRVRLTVSASLNSRDNSSGKPLLHKDGSILGINRVWNYRAEVGMLRCLQGSTK